MSVSEPAVETSVVPRRCSDVELLGRVDQSGYQHPVWLVCVGGQRYFHATGRMYHVLLYADGLRSLSEIAKQVVADTGEDTSPDQVAWLVQNRLQPAGLVMTEEDTTSARRPAPMPLVAIRHRLPLFPPQVTAPVISVLQHLYWPPVIVLAVTAALGINGWLYFGGGLHRSIIALLGQPAWLLPVLALELPQRTFHELGHASALRRGGVRHGMIGLALYVIIPVFYSDVTHAYRLPRSGRIRTDLGGMYFDCVSTAVFFTAYVFTGQPVLLLGIVMIGLGVLTEFTPFMRFDGYYLLADLVGVPEPMALFKGLLRDLWPTRWRSSARLRLRRTARLVLLAYLVVVVAFLLRPALLIGAVGDRLLLALVGQGPQLILASTAAFRGRDWGRLGVDGVNLLSWALVVAGLVLFGFSLLRLVWKLARLSAARLRRWVAERRTQPQARGTLFARDTMAFRGIVGGPDLFWRRCWSKYALRTASFVRKGVVALRKVAAQLAPWTKQSSYRLFRRGVGGTASTPTASTIWSTSKGGGLALCESSGKQVAMSIADMRHHAHLLGPTGVGKTTVLERTLLDAVLDQGVGGGYIDVSDGAAVQHILERIPVDEWNRVVLIDPAHPHRTVGLNPLDCPDPSEREGVADLIVAMLRGLFGPSGWGVRMDEVMRTALLTLMSHRGMTLCDLPPLLMDHVARARWTQYLEEPSDANRFWAEYEEQASSGYIPGVTPMLGKLRKVLLHPDVRVTLGQSEPTLDLLDLEEILDRRGILLARFDRFSLGDEAASLLGSVMVSRIWQAARHRAAIPEDEYSDFWQVIDEFQNLTHSFEVAGVDLVASSSLRIGWGLAHQYPIQLSERLKAAVEGNTGTKMYFTGAERMLLGDAQLGGHQAVVSRSDRAPVVGTTLPPTQSFGSRHAEELAAHSLALWGRSRAKVEAELAARHNRLPVGEGADQSIHSTEA